MSTLASVFGYGLLSARPAASVAGRFYYATDTQLMYRDNGSTWDTLLLAGAGTGTVTTVKNEGSNLSTAVVSLDFVGAGVDATGTTAVTVTIPGGVTRSTLGTTSAGASFANRGVFLKKITMASAGLLASINVHIKGNGTNNLVIAPLLYSDSSGNPTNLLAAPGPTITDTGTTQLFSLRLNTTARWLSYPIGAWLAAADYWIGVYLNDPSGGGNAVNIAYSSGTGSDRTVAAGTINNPMDSSLQAISTGTNDYSIYADIIR